MKEKLLSTMLTTVNEVRKTTNRNTLQLMTTELNVQVC